MSRHDTETSDEELNALFERCGWSPRYSWHRARQSSIRLLTERRGGALVGLARLARTNTRATVYDLVVDPQWRRQRIADGLMGELERAAREAGYDRIHADTAEEAARSLFEARAYRRVDQRSVEGRTRWYYEKDLRE